MSKNQVLGSIQALLARSGLSHTVLLTSFRRDGEGVDTPVGMRSADGKLYFMTPANTGKVKRLARNPHVTLALCTFRGKVLGTAVEGVARRLDGAEAKRAREVICAGLAGWVVDGFFTVRYPGDKTAVYEVALQPTRHSRAEERSTPSELGV